MKPKDDVHSAHLVDVTSEVHEVAELIDSSTVEPGRRALLYLRVSTPSQVKTDYDPEGISIPAQRQSGRHKANQMGLTIVAEYIEPGRSATEMTKRRAFQQMLKRVREKKDVDYIIVYKLNRMARNRIDDALVMADLRKRGVTLISATEAIDDTPVGQLMHGILAAFNEYRSREDGSDIKYKMSEKAKRGGTLGRAPLGYNNIIERFEGREIRTVVVDEERAPLVKLAFEMYATGNYSIDDICDELYNRGLTTKATRRTPARRLQVAHLARMLRSTYYTGTILHDGEEYPGRHTPLIDRDLFARVQDILDSRRVAGIRRRKHHHYLKGSLYCGHCRDVPSGPYRMIFARVSGRGGLYYYYFCRGTKERLCDAPYARLAAVDKAVMDLYASLRFNPELIASMRQEIEKTLADIGHAESLFRKQLTAHMKKLAIQEGNLLRLAAEGGMPKTRIKEQLRAIAADRSKIQNQLDDDQPDLRAGAGLLEAALQLFTDPRRRYLSATDEERCRLNQAIFYKIYVYQDVVTGYELQEPFAQLHAVYHGHKVLTEGGTPDEARKAIDRALAEHTPDDSGAVLPRRVPKVDAVLLSEVLGRLIDDEEDRRGDLVGSLPTEARKDMTDQQWRPARR